MNWLTNFVPPKLRQLVVRDTPENLWLQCPNCSQMLFHRDLEKAHKVCTHCGHHMRLGAKERLALMFDDGAYTLADLPPVQSDPLRFRDQKRYVDRMKDAQSKTGLQDAVLVAEGTIGGMPAVAAAFAFEFMGGSMGIAVGDAILRAARLAVEKRAALIAIPASGGARMQEGILSLMQMPRTTVAVAEVREAGLPYIVVMTDPTTGRRHRLRRPAGHPRDDPRDPAGRLPARRVPLRARHARHGRPPPSDAGDAGPYPRHADAPGRGGRSDRRRAVDRPARRGRAGAVDPGRHRRGRQAGVGR